MIEHEKKIYLKRIRFNSMCLAALFLLIAAAFVFSLSLGAANINLFDILARKNLSHDNLAYSIFYIRLPRSLAALFAGMALALAGILMQGVFQNPLVSPYTLGVSNGAAFGASVAIIFRAHLFTAFPLLHDFMLPLSAFVFSLLTMFLVYGIARLTANSGKTLLLSGVAIGYLFAALVASMRYMSNVRELPELVFWTMGGLNGVPPFGIFIIAAADTAVFVFMMIKAWDMNALALGEEQALSLGVNYRRIRIIAFVTSTLITSAAVSFTGVIGFIGLIAPHITRMIMGSDYRWNIPACALMGALLLLVSDTAARTIIAPSELPVGILTSFIGVPFFLYLIIRKR